LAERNDSRELRNPLIWDRHRFSWTRSNIYPLFLNWLTGKWMTEGAMYDNSDALADLIALIYEAALDQQMWPHVADRLADAAGATVCQISTYDGITQTSANVAPRVPSDALRGYAEYWVHHNPLISAGRRQPLGKVLSIHDLISRDELVTTAFYHGFLAPLGLEEKLGAKLVDDGSCWAAFGVWRPSRLGPFNRSIAERLAELVPHLQRALYINARTAELEMTRTASAELLNGLQQPVLLVDAACRILFANRASEDILTDILGLRSDTKGVLRGSLPAETDMLHKAVAQSACPTRFGGRGGGSLLLSRGGLRSPLTVLVIPLPVETYWLAPRRPAAVLFLTDPERTRNPTAASLQCSFGLTRTEAAMAIEVLNGGGLKAVAARLGIAPTTARTHLTSIFNKTRTRRQAELVRILLRQ
jgi:DNA-binding CsgD family transcriptional regulator